MRTDVPKSSKIVGIHPHITLAPTAHIEKGVSRFRQAEDSHMKRRDSGDIFPGKVERRGILHGQRENTPITKLGFVQEDSLRYTFSVVDHLAAGVEAARIVSFFCLCRRSRDAIFLPFKRTIP